MLEKPRELLFMTGIVAGFALAVWMYASMFLGRDEVTPDPQRVEEIRKMLER